jgi:pimeloyl-ACP methyl ester carboxylesterase
MPREEFRTLNGLRHHLLVWDGPRAPSVVLVHGWLDLAWSFEPFARELQARLPSTLVAPDLRGYGDSDRAPAGGYYHFADYVADLHDLVSGLPAPRFLVGHSMGGGIAGMLCGAFPGLVDRLVLVEGLGPPRTRPDTPPERMARWIREVRERAARPPRPMTSLEEAARRLREANPRLPEPFSLWLAAKATREVPGGRVWKYDPLHRTASPMPTSAETHRAFLRAIECPTLLVEGAESRFRDWIDDGRETDLRHMTSRTIAGAGHMLQHDNPSELAEAVAAFLAAP